MASEYLMGFDQADGPSRAAWTLMRRDEDGTFTLLACGTGEIAEDEARRTAAEVEARDIIRPAVGRAVRLGQPPPGRVFGDPIV